MDLRNLFELTAWFNLNRARANSEELVKQGRHNEALRRGLKGRKDCPYCGAKLPKIGVEICMHCRKELAWVYSTPCKPGTEPQVKKKLDKERTARLQELEERANQAEAERQLAEKREAERKKRMRSFNIGGYIFCITVAVVVFGWTAHMENKSPSAQITPAILIATVVTSIYVFLVRYWRRR